MRLAIIGAGPGGYVSALRASDLGAEVTLIEKEEVGGTCLNRGCIPTKAMLASSEMLVRIKESDKFGIELRGEAVANLQKIIDRKNRIVSTNVKGIRSLLKGRSVTLVEGRGELVSPNEVKVLFQDGTIKSIQTDAVIIATGSRPASIPTLPYDGSSIISSTEALDLTEIPKSLIIVGAGVIGCEFACIYRELGSEVTIIEALPRALSTEDHEISELMEREFRKKKIRLVTDARIELAKADNDGVHAHLEGGEEITAEKMLVSIGRAFNSNDLGLDNLGILKGPKGEIIADGKMKTNIDGIYAVGDVTGILLLAHVASRQGIAAANNALGLEDIVDYSVVPSAIFTSPEIASVGLREHQAKEKKLNIRTGHFQFRSLGKAHAMGEIAGFVKIISDEPSGKILGGHIIGSHASDLIHEIALAMKAGLTAKDIGSSIHAHPTLSEAIMEASEDVYGEAVHVQKK